MSCIGTIHNQYYWNTGNTHHLVKTDHLTLYEALFASCKDKLSSESKTYSLIIGDSLQK